MTKLAISQYPYACHQGDGRPSREVRRQALSYVMKTFLRWSDGTTSPVRRSFT